MEAYVEAVHQPFRSDLRRKFALHSSDPIQAFTKYPCNPDQWEDANIGKVFDYIWAYKNLHIPQPWLGPMKAFYQEYMEVRNNVA